MASRRLDSESIRNWAEVTTRSPSLRPDRISTWPSPSAAELHLPRGEASPVLGDDHQVALTGAQHGQARDQDGVAGDDGLEADGGVHPRAQPAVAVRHLQLQRDGAGLLATWGST